ncbi:uncharacterized protein EHS24_004532 [Apiotrichum porosum]|uniref:Uncharacterized protein n=1 Tax=Apiotrichum porosum TaxID=105984 RepID=A0A427Y5F0_9TREE|nr:uncharacterized protein EHS24_004532 [Apiotrichum porosum]RSH86292.1 hypothetical protein EHS24_004532 [Apiotrichum porosum]
MDTTCGDHLTFSTPAKRWVEALPLGNGSIGAMVFGDPWDERIALNEASLWSGSPRNEQEGAVPSYIARPAIAEARKAVLERRFDDATAAVQQVQSRYSQTYAPLGDLRLCIRPAGEVSHGEVSGYSRSLDIERGIHTINYTIEGEQVKWATCASYPDGVLQLRIDSTTPLDIRAEMASQLVAEPCDINAHTSQLVATFRAPSDLPPPHEPHVPITWSDMPGDAMRVAVVVGITHDGVEETPADSGKSNLVVRGVHHLTLVLATTTTFVDPKTLPGADVMPAVNAAQALVDSALARGAQSVLTRHVEDHTRLYNRVRLQLPDTPLHATLFDYGRYLLIAGSRGGFAPMNLQGIWNEDLRPPWSSNYTVNINLQMNYFGVYTAGLAEMAAPLHNLVSAIASAGQDTAQRLYGASGWVAHHNSDIWAYSSPVGMGSASPQWAFWPMGGVWLALSFAEHVRHGCDDVQQFAREQAFPVLRGAMAFALDWVFYVDGVATTAPSTSPENTFQANDGTYAVGRSSTMDLALISELGHALLEIATVAGTEEDEIVIATRDKLLPSIPRIVPGRDGLIPEWADDDPQAEPQHRHISHLFGLYPGTTLCEPDQREAASASLDDRGDDSTGWSIIWKLAARARLRDTAAVDRLLKLVFRPADCPDDGGQRCDQRGGLYPNLFSAHPPFQIDGNLGYVAAVAECLVQSHDGVITLLPALPTSWPAGSVTGLVARPGVRVDISWSCGTLDYATLAPLANCERGELVVQLGSVKLTVALNRGAKVRLSHIDFE